MSFAWNAVVFIGTFLHFAVQCDCGVGVLFVSFFVVAAAVVYMRMFLICSPLLSLSLFHTITSKTCIMATVCRSLGVHISFVRSIAMDSWTDQQLALMKGGGNDKCNDFLKKHGIDARCPIKQKYESDAAQLYKLVLKARIEGKPEPTQLPAPVARAPYSGGGGGVATSGGGGGQDPNGMERLIGESDQQYVARQTRLREEAKARMAMKFGGGGMGGVGSGGGSSGRMQGIGSDPNYNPNGSSSSSGGLDVSVDSLVSGLGSAWKLGGSVASSVRQTVLSEDNVQAVKSTGASFWGSLTSTVATVASQIDPSLASSSSPDHLFGGSDGLAQLQRQVAAQRPAQSKYGGFGSDQAAAASSSGGGGGGSSISSLGLQECPGMPGEDRDGIERLTGESDEQYVLRQTRLRDEARARMAAKFGGGGATMTSVSSSSLPARKNSYTSNGSNASSNGGGGGFGGGSGSFSSQSPARPATAPSSGNSASFTPSKGVVQSAPSSGNGQKLNSNDFFSSFGT
jgi:ADP-ribosylation factor GTPase-activating protein 1